MIKIVFNLNVSIHMHVTCYFLKIICLTIYIFIIKIVSKFMWGQHYNYSLKFVSCVHLIFLIFVPSELMSTKY